MARVPSRGSDQFVVRFPEGMRDRIAQEAEKAGRSMNAEIVHRLLHTFTPSEDLWQARVDSIATTMEAMAAVMGSFVAMTGDDAAREHLEELQRVLAKKPNFKKIDGQQPPQAAPPHSARALAEGADSPDPSPHSARAVHEATTRPRPAKKG